ncbi:MAG: protein kinase [Alphaproteobacteria bacterium]|nr:protein kinase [Alphaproteobacteria bacterium]
MSFHVGDTVAMRFEVLERVGSGGMGAVYKARDQLTGGTVALKALQSQDPDAGSRFRREAQVLAALRHDAIVRYVAHGASDVTPWLAMEWLEGEDLSWRLKREGIPVDQSLRMIKRAAAAVGEAHACGIVHRDLKPGNLFLVGGDPDRVKVIDFGIARLRPGVSELTSGATMTGTMLGTVGYLAPEQARGEATVGPASDVFSLAVVLYHCVTGRRPFLGANPTAVLAKILFEEAPRARELRPELSVALDDLLARALSKSPSDRPVDGRAFAEQIGGLSDIARAAEPAAPVVSLTTGELRFVSVVVAAPAMTSRAALSDAETVRLDRAVPVRLEDLAERYGARLERLADGVVVSALQIDTGATDQAARAARFAIAMSQHWSGPVAMASGRAEWVGRLPVGEAIDRAMNLVHARLKTDARIRLDEVTAGLLDARFEVGGAPPVLELVRERPQPSGARTLLGREIPCVGRTAEIATLKGLCARSAEESLSQAILLVGPAGVGKSRVRYELLRSVVDTEVWVTRGDPMSAGSAYQVVAEVVRRAAGVGLGDSPEVRWNAVRQRVARRVPADQVERVSTFLAEMTGTPHPGAPPPELEAARADPALMADQVARAFEDWLRGECKVHPVLMVLEDLHWGDAPSVALLDRALRELEEEPLCVLGLARPELRELFPGLWEERNLQEIRLNELSRRSAERLVREALGDRVPSDEIVSRVVDRASGNAFWLEELVRAVAEGRGEQLPETVLAMAAARLDALDPEDRRILRAASVFGGTTWRGGILALLGGSENTGQISSRLALLVHREVLTPRRDSRFPDEPEYTFRHALVREAAYAALTEADRELGHRLAAEWLVSVGEADPLLLAEHRERAGQREQAATHWLDAARHALSASDFRGACTQADRVAGLTDQAAIVGEARLVQAEALRWLGEFREAAARAEEALNHLAPRTRAWSRAAAERAEAAVHLGDTSIGVTLGEELCRIPAAELEIGATARMSVLLLHDARFELAHRVLERVDAAIAATTALSPSAEASVAIAHSYRALYEGDMAASLELDQRVVAAYRRAGDERAVTRYQNSVAYDHIELGQYAEAEEILLAAIPAAERLRLGGTPSIMRQNLALAQCRLGRVDEGIELQRRAIRELLELGDQRFAASSRVYLAAALVDAGRLDEAEAEARLAVDDSSYSGTAQAYALAVHARALLALGRTPEALTQAEAGFRWLARLGAVEEGEAAVRLAYARALRAAGRAHEAAEVAAEARSRLSERAAKISDERVRTSFLEQIPDHAATLRL